MRRADSLLGLGGEDNLNACIRDYEKVMSLAVTDDVKRDMKKKYVNLFRVNIISTQNTKGFNKRKSLSNVPRRRIITKFLVFLM